MKLPFPLEYEIGVARDLVDRDYDQEGGIVVGQMGSRVKLGTLSHIGIVVKDMDRAMKYYGSVFGLGPFTTNVYELKGFMYRGQPANARVKAGIAYSGRIFIELIEVLEGETAHTEFLRKKGEGVQHIAFTVENLDEALAELAKDGIQPTMRYNLILERPSRPEAEQPSGATKRRFEVKEAYLDSEGVGGTVIQLMQIRRLETD